MAAIRCSVFLFCLVATTVSAQVKKVTIGNTTFGLDYSPSCLQNPSCLRGASVIAKEAVAAATAEYQQAKANLDGHNKKVEAHLNDVAVFIRDAQQVQGKWADFVKDRLSPHNEDALNQHSAIKKAASDIDAFNGLPNDQKTSGEAERLNKNFQEAVDWGNVVDTRKAQLVQDGSMILEEKDNLTDRKIELSRQNQALRGATSTLKFREGEAYRQLLICVDYSKQVNALMGRFTGQSANLINLNDADEQIKNRSNKVFGEGNNTTTDFIPARPTQVIQSNPETYKARMEMLVNSLPANQLQTLKSSKKAIVPAPAPDKSVSENVVSKFKRWLSQ